MVFFLHVSPAKFCKHLSWRTQQHCWCKYRWCIVTLDSTHQRHFRKSLTNFQHQVEYANTFSLSTWQSKGSRNAPVKNKRHEYCNISFIPDCTPHKWQFITYFAQWFSDCVRNVSHITYLTCSVCLYSLWECSLGLRLWEEMLLK